MRNIYGMTITKLEEYFVLLNEKKFKAIQVFEWLYDKRVDSFEEMSNIKKNVIDRLIIDFEINKLKIVKEQKGKDVSKYLFELSKDVFVEAVLMRHDYGNSLCVSSQVGCNMGCTFCESGRLKKVRNLEVYEMVLQVLMVEDLIGQRISHVVVMGIGEPFDNYDNVMDFIKIINHPKGLAIGSRHITVSTCGIVPRIRDFMKEEGQVNLAISLHAPNDELRSKLMSINKAYPLKEIMSSINDYISYTNRRVTFEYILLKGINDGEKEALELSLLLRGLNAYVNLIPYNETSNDEYKRSSFDTIMKFYDILKKNKIGVTIRKEFGDEVDAACGQLRSNYVSKEDN